MIDELITAFVLGLIGGMIPGPVITAIFTEILQSSFLKSFRIIFIAMFMETLVALCSLVFFISINFSEAIFRGISIIGALILILIGFSIWKVKKIESGEKVNFRFWKISTTLLAFIFSRFRKLLSNPKMIPIIFKIFALTFFYFAIDMTYKSIIFFIQNY